MDRSRITWKIRGAVQVYDSFTARPANLSWLRVLTEEGICVMKKTGGLLVFAEGGRGGLTDGGDPIRVRLESPVFLPEELTLSSSPENLPVCLRLRPGKSYPAPPGAGILYGHCPPGTELFFVFDVKAGAEGGNGKKLLSDLPPGGKSVEIYHPGRVSLEGEWVEFAYGDCRERLFLGQKEGAGPRRPDTGRYALCGLGASGNYPRLETELRLAYAAKSDGDGSYVFYFRSVPGGSAPGRVCVRAATEGQGQEKGKKPGKGKKAEWEVTVRQGESTRLDLQ